VTKQLRWLAAVSFFVTLSALAPTAATAGPVRPEPVAPAAEAFAGQPVLEVFVRDGCPHCADAKVFLTKLARERPALTIVYRWVDRDEAARDELVRIFNEIGSWPPGVPTFVIDGAVLVGFDDESHTGSALRTLVDRRAGETSGPPPPSANEVDTALFGTLSASRLGLPLFTIALGLVDGFNPCAMWVLLFLLSLLVRLDDRKRMAVVAGTFVLISGAVYYAFMAAWLNIFLAIGMSNPVRLGLAGVALAIGSLNVKDFFAMGKGISVSIPDQAKPGIYARVRAILRADTLPASLAAVAVLAVAVNFVELLCTAGLPAIYTAVLTQQGLSPAAHYGYLGLYIVGYIADDALMVTVAVVALGNLKLTERGGQWLKLLSGLVMVTLGVVMLLRPDWLV
jgi:glutaredoxin